MLLCAYSVFHQGIRSLAQDCWQVCTWRVLFGKSKWFTHTIQGMREWPWQLKGTQPWWKHLHVVWSTLPLPQTFLPGIALAQRTTATSCLSPSSLRLVSKDAGLSGSAGSCPALTTAGSIVCRTLSRDMQERSVGGMLGVRAWDADKDGQNDRMTHTPTQEHQSKMMQKHFCTWAGVTPILTTLRPGHCTPSLQGAIFLPSMLSHFSRPPHSCRTLLLHVSRLSGSLQPAT